VSNSTKITILSHVLENRLMFEHAKKFCFLQNQTYPEVVRRQSAWFFATKRLACIITGSQPFGLFCLEIHVGQTRLYKTDDFGQIQNPAT
jgi:hypothetical protein